MNFALLPEQAERSRNGGVSSAGLDREQGESSPLSASRRGSFVTATSASVGFFYKSDVKSELRREAWGLSQMPDNTRRQQTAWRVIRCLPLRCRGEIRGWEVAPRAGSAIMGRS